MRILLAEDERSLSSALVTILKYNNFSVDACYDGLKALSFLNVNNYDFRYYDAKIKWLRCFKEDDTPDFYLIKKIIRKKLNLTNYVSFFQQKNHLSVI